MDNWTKLCKMDGIVLSYYKKALKAFENNLLNVTNAYERCRKNHMIIRHSNGEPKSLTLECDNIHHRWLSIRPVEPGP